MCTVAHKTVAEKTDAEHAIMQCISFISICYYYYYMRASSSYMYEWYTNKQWQWKANNINHHRMWKCNIRIYTISGVNEREKRERARENRETCRNNWLHCVRNSWFYCTRSCTNTHNSIKTNIHTEYIYNTRLLFHNNKWHAMMILPCIYVYTYIFFSASIQFSVYNVFCMRCPIVCCHFGSSSEK